MQFVCTDVPRDAHSKGGQNIRWASLADYWEERKSERKEKSKKYRESTNQKCLIVVRISDIPSFHCFAFYCQTANLFIRR